MAASKKVTKTPAAKQAAKKATAKKKAKADVPSTAQKPLETRILTAEGWTRRKMTQHGERKVGKAVSPPSMKPQKGKRKG